jgi:acyl carrier protein
MVGTGVGEHVAACLDGVISLEEAPGLVAAGGPAPRRRDPVVDESAFLLEVGPGSDRRVLLEALARLWLAGLPIDWRAYDEPERRRRLSLPTYPFERQPYWSGPAPAAEPPPAAAPASYGRPPHLPPYVPPEGPLQARVAAIWENVFGIDRVGAADGFRDLGGDSLVAVQVLARLREAFDLDLPPHLLLGHANVAGVAAGIEELLAVRPSAEV